MRHLSENSRIIENLPAEYDDLKDAADLYLKTIVSNARERGQKDGRFRLRYKPESTVSYISPPPEKFGVTPPKTPIKRH